MSTNRHLKVIPASTNNGPFGPLSSLWRNVALASVVLAIVLMGVAGGVFSPYSGVELQVPEAQSSQAPAPAAKGREEFVYFPSQHVNQATESGTDVPTF